MSVNDLAIDNMSTTRRCPCREPRVWQTVATLSGFVSYHKQLIRLTHTTKRLNYAHVRKGPRVALMISDPDDPYRYIRIRSGVQSLEPHPTGVLHEALQTHKDARPFRLDGVLEAG